MDSTKLEQEFDKLTDEFEAAETELDRLQEKLSILISDEPLEFTRPFVEADIERTEQAISEQIELVAELSTQWERAQKLL